MATQQWKTVSIRLTEQEENALKMLCEKRDRKKHKIVKELLLKELEPILKPGQISEGEGIPIIGEHHFKYNPEKDNFTWQIDLGIHGIRALAENIPFTFVTHLDTAVTKAIEQRKKVESKLSKEKTRIPKDILKYRVK